MSLGPRGVKPLLSHSRMGPCGQAAVPGAGGTEARCRRSKCCHLRLYAVKSHVGRWVSEDTAALSWLRPGRAVGSFRSGLWAPFCFLLALQEEVSDIKAEGNLEAVLNALDTIVEEGRGRKEPAW